MGAHKTDNDLIDVAALNGEFNEYKRLIVYELKRLSDAIKELDRKERKNRDDIIIIKVKAGIWGLIGASIPTIIAIALLLIKSELGAP